MSRSIYDKQLVRWVKSHHWDSLEKDKDIILRHIRTFAGGDIAQENAEAQKPSPNKAMVPCDHKFIVYFDCVICVKCRAKFYTENAQHQ